MRGVLVLIVASGCRSLLGFEELGDPATPPGDSSSGDSSNPPPSDSMPADASIGPCPASYTISVASSSSVYRNVTNIAVPFVSANDRCTQDHPHAHLIVLDNAAELADIQDATGTAVRWVGLSDRVVDETFVPVTDQPVNFPPASGPPWAAGEPMVGTADCVAMGNEGDLITLACGNGRNYVCECDDFASDSTNF